MTRTYKKLNSGNRVTSQSFAKQITTLYVDGTQCDTPYFDIKNIEYFIENAMFNSENRRAIE